MPRRPRRPASVAAQLAELSVAAQQVVAHRVARMALAGPNPSARDRRELTGMIVEKQVAFVQSWQAMFTAGLAAQQALAQAWLGAFTGVATGRPAMVRKAARKASRASAAIASGGLAPVHRKAVANARRLAKTRVR